MTTLIFSSYKSVIIMRKNMQNANLVMMMMMMMIMFLKKRLGRFQK